ncbi:MAG: hypothetical protein DIU80_021165 [Chloroflexota bacterium]|nr:MAG: hypothetical protein DIU80_14630 [Chloroflexota bacterium]
MHDVVRLVIIAGLLTAIIFSSLGLFVKLLLSSGLLYAAALVSPRAIRTLVPTRDHGLVLLLSGLAGVTLLTPTDGCLKVMICLMLISASIWAWQRTIEDERE